MAYWQELQPYRPTARLLRFSNAAAITVPPAKGLASRLMPYVKAYCESSSIHCMAYLTNEKKQRWQRALWAFILLATSVGAMLVYFDLAELYATQRIQTTIQDTLHPVFYVPFPSVGICPRNAIDWLRLQYAHERFLPGNASAATVEAFHRFFGTLEDLRFDRLAQLAPFFANASLATTQLRLLAGVDLLEVMRYLTISCVDIFEPGSCYWRRRRYDCCELFTLELTEVGFCHVFNSAVSPEVQARSRNSKYYPYHNSQAGERSGLEANVKLNASKLQPKSVAMFGVYVMVKQPEQWHDNVRYFNADTQTKMAVVAQETRVDERTRVVSPEVRGCLFEDESNAPQYKKIHGLLYWRGNCRTRCHQEYLVQLCNCSTSLLFPRTQRDNFTECRAQDFECIYTHNAIFSTERHEAENNYVEPFTGGGMVCNCLNSCNQLVYMSTVTTAPLEGGAADHYKNDSSIKLVRLDVYHHSVFMLKYNTLVRYTFVELLANFGGVIGLFLGASMLSAVELGYFVLIGLWAQLRCRRQANKNGDPRLQRQQKKNQRVDVHSRY